MQIDPSVGPGPRRRAAIRRDVRIPCEIVADIGFRLLGERSLDVSRCGMLIALRPGAEARIGEEVVLAFVPPGARSFIDAQARVARVLAGRRAGEVRAVALEFVAIEPLDRALLIASLYGHRPTRPRRPFRRDYAALVGAIARR